jgi:O-antigen ligase
MGIGSLIKILAPLSLYGAGIICAILAFGGYVRWSLMLMIFLIPLRNIIERVQGLPLGNQFIDILLASIMIGWAVNCALSNRTFFQRSTVNALAVIVVFYTLISVVLGGIYLHGEIGFSIHDPRIQDWKNFCLLPLFFYATLNNISTKKEVWSILIVMCLAMLLMDYYTINQIHWYSSLESRYKITATFQFLGPNEVAAFFNEYTIILLAVFYSMKKNVFKWPLFCLIAVNTFCILFTYSRGAYAGFLVGLLILFAIKDRKMLIPIILIVGLWQTALPEKVVERIKETKTETGQLDESSQRRINIWEQALALFQTNPITGIGFGVFRYLGLDLGDTHNIYVKLLTEQGIVGLLIFLSIVFAFMREAFILYQKGEDDQEKGLGLGLLICMFVMLVNNFFGDRWSYMEANAYLWIFAGLVSRLNAFAREAKPVAQPVVSSAPVVVEPIIERLKKKIQIEGQTEKIKKKLRYYDLKEVKRKTWA